MKVESRIFFGDIMVDTMMILSQVVCSYPDDDYENLKIEVVLPGVEKKDISFKLAEDSFYIAANKAGVKYVASDYTCCPVDPEKQSPNIQMVY